MSILSFVILAAVAALSCMSVPAIFNVIKEFCFSVPFSGELVSRGVINSTQRGQMVSTDMFGAVFMMLCFLCGQIWLASMVSTPGYVVLVVSLAVCFFVFRPSKDMFSRSDFNIYRFAAKHGLLENSRFKKNYQDVLSKIA